MEIKFKSLILLTEFIVNKLYKNVDIFCVSTDIWKKPEYSYISVFIHFNYPSKHIKHYTIKNYKEFINFKNETKEWI